MEKLLWYIIAGTRGGVNRARIIKVLHSRPYNTNQLSEMLGLDYKTVKHHIKMLKKNNIITSSGDDYGALHFLQDSLERNYEVFEKIWNRVKQEEQK